MEQSSHAVVASGVAPKPQQRVAKKKPAQQQQESGAAGKTKQKQVLRPRRPWHVAYPFAPQVTNVDSDGVAFVPGEAPSACDMSRSAASTVVAAQQSLSSSTPSVPVRSPSSRAVVNSSSSVSSTSKSDQDKGRKHKDKRKRDSKRRRSSSRERRRGKGKKSRRRSSSSSSRSSSSESSLSSEDSKKRKQRSGRKREPPFKPDDKEIHSIFMQLVTNNPFLHTRRGVNQVWKGHLQKLHGDGIALDCTKQKTFTAWATKSCKDRYLLRLAESRKNGTGEVMPPSPLDEVMRKWEEKKLGAKTSNNPMHAELLREACTNTADKLDAMTDKIQKATAQKYGEGAREAEHAKSESPTPRRRTPTPTSASKFMSPSGRGTGNADARMAFGEAMLSMTRAADNEAQLMQQLLAVMQQQQETPQPVAGEEHVEHAKLLATLQSAGDEYHSLVSFAPAIYAALGVTVLSDFAFVTVSDVETVPLPAMQKRTLLRLARAHSVGTKAHE